MPVDATVLALGADTSDVRPAFNDLDTLGKKAEDAEKKAERMAKTFEQEAGRIRIAIAASVAAVTAMLAVFINYADKLDETGEKLGLTAAQVGSLGYAASQSDTSLENLVARLGILADRASDAYAGSAKASAAFEAMGISVADANGALKDQDKLLLEIAEKFATYKDGTAKAALAQDLFGRGGRELIPLLNKGRDGIEELRKKYLEMAGDITTTAATASDFNDMLASVRLQVTLLFGQMAGPLMTALINIANAIRMGSSEADAFRIAGEAIALVFKTIATVAIPVVNILHQAGENLGALVAAVMAVLRGEFSLAWNILKENARDTIGAVTQTIDQLKEIWAAPVAAAKKGAEGITAPTAVAAKAIKEHKEAISAELRALIGDYNWFVDELTKTASANSKYEEAMVRLTKVAKAFGLSQAEVTKVSIALRQELDLETKALIANTAAWEQVTQDMVEALGKTNTELAKQLEAERLSGQEIGKTSAQLLILRNAREDATIALKEETLAAMENAQTASPALLAAMRQELDLLKQIREQRQSNQAAQRAADIAAQYRDAWVSAYQSINNAAEQAFTSMLDGSRDAVSRIADMLKSTLYSALYQLTVKPFIINFVASLSGMGASTFTGGAGGGSPFGLLSGLFGGGEGAGGLSGLLNGGFNFANIGGLSSTFSGLAGSFATSGLGQTLGLSAPFFGVEAAGAAGLTGAGAGLMAAMGAIGTALPYVAIALAIASALGAFDRGGPKTGGYASTAGLDLGAAFAGDENRYFSPNSADASLRKVVDQTQASFNTLYQALGGAGGSVFGFGVGYDADPQGDANNRAHVGAFINGRQVYDYQSGDDALGKDPELLQQTIDLETRRALLAALQESDLPEYISAILNSLDAAVASAEDITNVTQFAQAFQALYTFLSDADPLKEAQELLDAASRSSVEQLAYAAMQLRDMADTFDGTTTALGDLSQATSEYYTSLVRTLAMVQQIRDGIHGMLGDTRTDLQMSVMTDEQRRQFYQMDALRLRDQLQTASSPEEVQRILEQINQDIRQAWELLSPEQQTAALAEQLRLLDEIQAEADTRLDDIATTIEDAGRQTLDDMRALLDGFVQDLREGNATVVSTANANSDAAKLNMEAAQIQLKAANTPHVVELVEPGVVNG